jgi:valyl-tRNA synthetase
LTARFSDIESLAKREAKRLERLAKAAVKQAATAVVHPRKDKKQKEKKEVAPDEEWVNITPKGEKKGK